MVDVITAYRNLSKQWKCKWNKVQKKNRPWKWTLYFKVLKDQRRSRDTVNLEACLHLQRVKDNPHFAQCRYKTVLRGKFASFESWNSGFWRKRGVRFGKQNCYWLLLQVGRMKWILYSDWLLEQASWPQRMFVPQEKSSLGHMMNPLLTKLVWLRWLDISLMFFFTILLPLRLSQSIIIPPFQTN